MAYPARDIIEVDPVRCLGCAQCINSCPDHALAMKKDMVVLVMDSQCRGRGRCTTSCKAAALHLVHREAAPYSPQNIDRK